MSDTIQEAQESAIIAAAVRFVQEESKDKDGSHDFWHIIRVMRTALSLAKEEGIKDLEAVQLAALLHDVKDYKYSGSENAAEDSIREFLVKENYPSARIDLVVRIVKGVGFNSELKGHGEAKAEVFPELAVVQDADRLDAIGAIGIARTFSYGGRFNRALYDPNTRPRDNLTQEQYKNSQNSPTINHFYEKLLLLKGLMKSNAGKRMAAERHQFMETFLDQFYAEWEGKRPSFYRNRRGYSRREC